MTAYIIVDMNVTDPERYDAYKQAAAPVVAQYGGKYIVRGGPYEVLEGDWRPHRVVLLEFENVDAAKRFYHSPEYAAAREKRATCATGNLIVVPGGGP